MAEQTDSKVPQIRFKGFEGEWVEKALGDVVDVTTGKLDANAMKSDGIYDFYTSGVKKYKIDIAAFEGPAITIAGNGATVGYMHIADGKFNAYQRTYILNNFKGDREFIFFSTGNCLPRKISEEARTGNIPYIVMDMLTELCLVIPEPLEQTKIGGYFKELDGMIALHQRKHGKLVTLKQAMLRKMFPQNGATTPEIRFKGFSEDWRLKRLYEISSLITKGTTPLSRNNVGAVNFIKVENIHPTSGRIIRTSKITEGEHVGYLKRSQLKDGDILFSIAGTLGRVSVVSCNILPANTNQALAIIRIPEGQTDYITTFLKGRAIADFIKTNPTVGAQPNLSLEQVRSFIILLPADEEQQKIGSYFRQLDTLISKHATQLEKLKQIKSACLEKMFV